MATLSRSTVLDAPLVEVWDAHASIEGLQSVTPGWAGLEIADVRKSADSPDDRLGAGTEIVLTLKPFGVLPGGRWVTRITAMEAGADRAMFRDELTSGPFPRWIHTHRFADLGFGTLLYDEVDYELPGPLPADAVKPALAALFAYRHWRLGTRFGPR